MNTSQDSLLVFDASQCSEIEESLRKLSSASEEQFSIIKNEKWYRRLWDMVTFSKKGEVRLCDQVSTLAQAQQIIAQCLLKGSQQSKEISELVKNNTRYIKILAEQAERLDLHQLILEIDHKIYNREAPLVALYHISSQISLDQASFYREKALIKVAMEEQGILSSSPMMVADIIETVALLPADQLLILYTALSQSHSSQLSRALFTLTEGLLFSELRGSATNLDTQGIMRSCDIPLQESTTLSDLFDQLLEQKKNNNIAVQNTSFSILQELQQAEELFFAGKLIEAFPLFKRKAEEKLARAFYYLSIYYSEGYGEIIEDNEQALEYAKAGMDLGDPLCTYIYGIVNFFVSKESPETWMKQKFKLLNPLIRNNDPCALFEQGKYYMVLNLINSKRSTEEDVNKAKIYMSRAAEKGFWPAAYFYNILSTDFEHPLNRFSKYSSILKEVESYDIQYEYGQYYLFVDFHVHKYFMQATKCFLRALALREDFKEPAGFVAFLLGTGLIEDSLRYGISKGSIPLYYKAGLSCDNPFTIFEYFLLYTSGVGEKGYGANLTKAYDCAKKCYSLTKDSASHKKMHLFVAAFLGECRLEGLGIEKNEKLAISYLNEAVNGGDSYSAKLLADYYSKGWKSIFRRSTINDLRAKCKGVREHEITEDAFFSIVEEALAASFERMNNYITH